MARHLVDIYGLKNWHLDLTATSRSSFARIGWVGTALLVSYLRGYFLTFLIEKKNVFKCITSWIFLSFVYLDHVYSELPALKYTCPFILETWMFCDRHCSFRTSGLSFRFIRYEGPKYVSSYCLLAKSSRL